MKGAKHKRVHAVWVHLYKIENEVKLFHGVRSYDSSYSSGGGSGGKGEQRRHLFSTRVLYWVCETVLRHMLFCR